MQEVRLWEVVSGKTLREISGSQISLEDQLEDWLANDISLLDPNLLVIGRQVHTDFGKVMDLLCLDRVGDTVVVELKKGQTPRDTVAQALEYASWVKDLSHERITEIADEYLSKGGSSSLAEAFQERFETELPQELNLGHRILVVAETIDASTRRIVGYLFDKNVPINVATVQQFTDSSGKSFLAQVYLIEPEEAETKSRAGSRRGPPQQTISGLQELAETNGVGKLYSRVRNGLRGVLSPNAYENRVWYRLRQPDGGFRTALIVYAIPHEDHGGLRFTLHATRLENKFGIGLDVLRTWLPTNSIEWNVSSWRHSSQEEQQGAVGLDGSFQSVDEVDKFVQELRGAIENSRMA